MDEGAERADGDQGKRQTEDFGKFTKCGLHFNLIVQFSYLNFTKRERQYSSDYVDLNKVSYKNIGVCSN